MTSGWAWHCCPYTPGSLPQKVPVALGPCPHTLTHGVLTPHGFLFHVSLSHRIPPATHGSLLPHCPCCLGASLPHAPHPQGLCSCLPWGPCPPGSLPPWESLLPSTSLTPDGHCYLGVLIPLGDLGHPWVPASLKGPSHIGSLPFPGVPGGPYPSQGSLPSQGSCPFWVSLPPLMLLSARPCPGSWTLGGQCGALQVGVPKARDPQHGEHHAMGQHPWCLCSLSAGEQGDRLWAAVPAPHLPPGPAR